MDFTGSPDHGSTTSSYDTAKSSDHNIDNNDSTNSNIDLNLIMHESDDSCTTEIFDYNALKTNDYDFLDENDFNPHVNDDFETDAYDFCVDSIEPEIPPQIFKMEPSQTIIDVHMNSSNLSTVSNKNLINESSFQLDEIVAENVENDKVEDEQNKENLDATNQIDGNDDDDDDVEQVNCHTTNVDCESGTKNLIESENSNNDNEDVIITNSTVESEHNYFSKLDGVGANEQNDGMTNLLNDLSDKVSNLNPNFREFMVDLFTTVSEVIVVDYSSKSTLNDFKKLLYDKIHECNEQTIDGQQNNNDKDHSVEVQQEQQDENALLVNSDEPNQNEAIKITSEDDFNESFSEGHSEPMEYWNKIGDNDGNVQNKEVSPKSNNVDDNDDDDDDDDNDDDKSNQTIIENKLGLKQQLKKIENFNLSLLECNANITNEMKDVDHTKTKDICMDHITKLELSFRNMIKDVKKNLSNLFTQSNDTECSEKAKLMNQKSKERWMNTTTSSDDETDEITVGKDKLIRRKRKRPTSKSNDNDSESSAASSHHSRNIDDENIGDIGSGGGDNDGNEMTENCDKSNNQNPSELDSEQHTDDGKPSIQRSNSNDSDIDLSRYITDSSAPTIASSEDAMSTILTQNLNSMMENSIDEQIDQDFSSNKPSENSLIINESNPPPNEDEPTNPTIELVPANDENDENNIIIQNEPVVIERMDENNDCAVNIIDKNNQLIDSENEFEGFESKDEIHHWNEPLHNDKNEEGTKENGDEEEDGEDKEGEEEHKEGEEEHKEGEEEHKEGEEEHKEGEEDVENGIATMENVETPAEMDQQENIMENSSNLSNELNENPIENAANDNVENVLDFNNIDDDDDSTIEFDFDQVDNELLNKTKVDADDINAKPINESDIKTMNESNEQSNQCDNQKITEISDETNMDQSDLQIESIMPEDIAVECDVYINGDTNDDDLNDDMNVENNDDEIGDDGNQNDNARDREIERLLDFSSLIQKRKLNENSPTTAKSVKPPKLKKVDKLVELFNDNDDDDDNAVDIVSNSESEEEAMTEQQYLKQCNLNIKDKLLTLSSSESDATESEDSLIANDNQNDDSDEDSNGSLMEKFLSKTNEINQEQIKNETAVVVDDEKETESKKQNGKSESADNNNAATNDKDEQTIEINDDDVGDDSVELKTKTPPPKSAYKLDKSLFNNNIFDNLTEYCENGSFTVADEDSPKHDKSDTKSDISSTSSKTDCSVLDISMCKSNLKTKTIDDERMKTILTNAQKPSTSKLQQQQSADCISLSSDSDLELEETTAGDEEVVEEKKRGVSRAILRNDQLAGETKKAQQEESERIKRLKIKNEKLTQILESQNESQSKSQETNEIVLDYDSKQKVNIAVHSDIVKQLKQHQVDGIKFMYKNCYGDVDTLHKYPGSGCILAHCMGLGKTLQLISLLHTLIRYPQLKTNKILVICPKSTVMNWADEIQRWIGPIKVGPSLKVFLLPDSSDINEKLRILHNWTSAGKPGHPKAGCMLIGYEAFRTLVFYHKQKKRIQTFSQSKLESIKKQINETLLDPGADLVICDEGHMIKNRKSSTTMAVNQIKTKRRIILTGTPIQNNLKEYYSMVDFIKPSYLGTEKEFANMYANPIKNGQHKDSTHNQIKSMKQRSFVLHKKLSKFVQRREASLLKTFLPEKYEYVLFIPMTEVQNQLYLYFLENNPLREQLGGKSLIPDYTLLRKIWTHPKVLEIAWERAIIQQKKDNAKLKKTTDSDDEQPDDILDNQSGHMSVTNDWWRGFVEQDELGSLLSSNKLRILFEILKMCIENGEKCLIFSAFVAVLNVVEYFMKEIHNRSRNTSKYGLDSFRGPWELGNDYYRLDGKTPKSVRYSMITKFNDPANRRTKCFLISAKAGGQGINLIGANRVILLDTSWNPSNDQQNIFRVFRLGQKEKCYIYRLLAMGTMEEKVYSRSVTKQAMSCRVVDEQQIDRHYNSAELSELYCLTKPNFNERPTPILPYDKVLASLLHQFPKLVYKYHEHDSLLERNEEQDLSEEEKADAWASYEHDLMAKNQTNNMVPGILNNYAGMQSPYFNTHGLPNFPLLMNYAATYGFNSPVIANYLRQMAYPGMETDLMLYAQMCNPAYNSMMGMNASGVGVGGSSGGGVVGRTSGGSLTTGAAVAGLSFGAPPYGMSNYNPYYSNSIFNQNSLLQSTPASAVASSSSPSSSSSSYASASLYNLSNMSNLIGSGSAGPLNMSGHRVSSTSPSTTTTTATAATTTTSATSSTTTSIHAASTNATLNPLSAFLSAYETRNLPTTMNSMPTTTATTTLPLSSSTTSASASLMYSPIFNGPMPTANTKSTKSTSSPYSTSTPINQSMSKINLPPLSSINHKDDVFNLPSSSSSSGSNSRTSVITKASTNIQHRNHPTNMEINLNKSATNRMANQSSNLTSRDGRDTTTISLIKRDQQMNAANKLMDSGHRRSSNTTATTTSSPAIISVAADRNSPEPHIIVKNVNAINNSIDTNNDGASSAAKQSTTTTTSPIKNFNMGIVYPNVNDNTKFDLSHNDSILKKAFGTAANNTTIQTAKSQLEMLTKHHNQSSVSILKTPTATTGTPPSTQTQSNKSIGNKSNVTIQQQQQQKQSTPISTKLPNSISLNAIQPNSTKHQKDSAILTKSRNLLLPTTLSSDVTISPSNKKIINTESGTITINPIGNNNNNNAQQQKLQQHQLANNKKPAITYTRITTTNPSQQSTPKPSASSASSSSSLASSGKSQPNILKKVIVSRPQQQQQQQQQQQAGYCLPKIDVRIPPLVSTSSTTVTSGQSSSGGARATLTPLKRPTLVNSTNGSLNRQNSTLVGSSNNPVRQGTTTTSKQHSAIDGNNMAAATGTASSSSSSSGSSGNKIGLLAKSHTIGGGKHQTLNRIDPKSNTNLKLIRKMVKPTSTIASNRDIISSDTPERTSSGNNLNLVKKQQQQQRPLSNNTQIATATASTSAANRMVNIKAGTNSGGSGGNSQASQRTFIIPKNNKLGTTATKSSASATSSAAASSSSSSLGIPQKRKIDELVSPNSSVSITEVKRLKTPSTSMDKKQGTRKSYDAVTITPTRNAQNHHNNQKVLQQKKSQLEIVELD